MSAYRSPASTRVDVAPIARLFGDGNVGARIERTFALMAVAEEEIKAAKVRWPRRRKALHGAFGALCPNDLARYGDDVYRAHCRELLGRVMRGEDVRPGTMAECLAALSDQSLRAPLTPGFAHAMSAAFRAVFPQAPAELQAGAESYAGATDEILAELRRKLSRDRRAP